MIAPVRNATSYAQRVAGSRVLAGARNVAQVSDETPSIETVAAPKRTGAQEESLLNQSLEIVDSPAVAADTPKNAGQPEPEPKPLDQTIEDSLGWNQRVREAAEAYRNVIENLDKTQPRTKPGDVYDAPF